MYPVPIQKLIEKFSKFPTIGPRTAARFVFYLLGKSEEDLVDLAETILSLKKKIKTCSFCFNQFEASSKNTQNLCSICSDPLRNKSLLCVVEKETDLISLEKIKKYKGRYFILGGTLSKIRKEDIEALRIKELKERISENPEIKEVIIATNPTIEGESTALYLERNFKPFSIKTTRLGRGLPTGGELEYADEETISSALESRK